tara:strand:- start:177 stop:860 length:684 start_codon:yes stop_codon:yes gene_type:complete
MLQQINKIKVYFYILCFLILTTISNNNLNKFVDDKFSVKKINIVTKFPEINEKITSKINFLYSENIFLIKKYELYNNLSEFKFLENIYIKKKYPSTLDIYVNRTDIIAITYIDNEKYYLGNNGKFIPTTNIYFDKKLPIIFGKFQVKDFFHLLNLLKTQKIEYEKIEKYYFHKNKRWDLYFENKNVIMLPNKNIIKSLKLLKKFEDKKSIKNTTIDLRINDRVILSR